MATENLTASTDSHALLEACDEATILTTKLNALLVMTYGEAGESFRGLNDTLQDSYMWACSGMATELRELVSKIDRLRHNQFKSVAAA